MKTPDYKNICQNPGKFSPPQAEIFEGMYDY